MKFYKITYSTSSHNKSRIEMDVMTNTVDLAIEVATAHLKTEYNRLVPLDSPCLQVEELKGSETRGTSLSVVIRSKEISDLSVKESERYYQTTLSLLSDESGNLLSRVLEEFISTPRIPLSILIHAFFWDEYRNGLLLFVLRELKEQGILTEEQGQVKEYSNEDEPILVLTPVGKKVISSLVAIGQAVTEGQ